MRSPGRSGDLHFASHGPEARSVLAGLLAEIKTGDPLAPVTVAVPSNYAGLSLRRLLAAEGGLLNARFMVLARVAELLGAPRIASSTRGPLTTPLRFEALRAAIAANPGPFADVAPEAADLVERSLDATFRDLAHCDNAALDAIAAAGPRASHVVTTYRAFRALTVERYEDRDLFQSAATAVRDDAAALGDVGHIILYLPTPPTPAEALLLEALAARGALSVVAGLTGDGPVDEVAGQRWANVLGSAPETTAASPPAGTAIVSTPDQEEEVREAVRIIGARAAAGTPLHRVALLYKQSDPYAQIAAEQLKAASVPWNGPSTVSVGQTLAGRTLLGFLALGPEGFEREAVAAWLNSAPILESANGRPAPSHLWEVLARNARVIRGATQWRQRLQHRAAELDAEYAGARADSRTEQWLLDRLEYTRDQHRRLTGFMHELFEATAPPSEATWAAHAHWAAAALERYLGGEGRTGAWPEEELAAYREISDLLDELEGLDALGLAVDAATFRRAVERSLQRRAGRIGRFGSGVFLGRLADAAGADFDLVVVLGMNEGSIPVAGREDPLLPDAERALGGETVPLHGHRAIEERREYLAALATAPERVLLVPRADSRAQQARLPSRYAVEAANVLEEARGGERIFASTLDDEHCGGLPWYRSVPSFESALGGAAEPASIQEYDLRSLLRRRRPRGGLYPHFLVEHNRALGEGFAAQRARRGSALTPWQGLVPAAGSRSPLSPDTRPVSATRLQGLAACPFRFFLDSVLGIPEFEKPEEELSISALAKGSLIHTILDRFIKAVPTRQSWEEAWTPEERAQLRAIAEEECDRAERDGITGRALLWAHERTRILRDLEHFLDEDEELRREFRTTTVASELPFGLEDAPPVEITLADGRSVRLRGYIDRVDRSEDGRLVVIDYKTGSAGPYSGMQKDALKRGTLLQLPVYAAAARASGLGTQESPVHALYWFISKKGEWVKAGYEVDAVIQREFGEILAVLGETVERGVFPARPGNRSWGDYENCLYCAYRDVCPPGTGRRAAWERMQRDPAVARYLALAEPEAAHPEDGDS